MANRPYKDRIAAYKERNQPYYRELYRIFFLPEISKDEHYKIMAELLY
ncbi:hypothetical protein HYS31_05810 [Candidatus Woesearchaeota archaeon]|nr:hypothetical protein [Candidatus Woesearchaeota archaeon]